MLAVKLPVARKRCLIFYSKHVKSNFNLKMLLHSIHKAECDGNDTLVVMFITF